MSSPFRTMGGRITSGQQQQTVVWIPTDLVDSVFKNGQLAANWKPRKRNRSFDDWGWCRAVVVSSVNGSAAALGDDDKKEQRLDDASEVGSKKSPFGKHTLRKTAMSPPTTAAKQKVTWGGSPKPVAKTVSMTVTVEDDDFAPSHLQGATVSFTYNTADHGEQQRVCRANEWWQTSSTRSGQTEDSPTDLTALEQLHEPAVVYCLRNRYEDDHIYTYTGKILLALNPFRHLSELYGDVIMEKYWRPNGGVVGKERPPPHIYAIAEDAYRNAIRSLESTTTLGISASKGESQSVLVSGESGAGKTVTTKIILQYLAVLSQKSDPTSAVGIESKVLESNPILESFGNARTVRNDNSSRFGKFIEMQFEQKGILLSASIETYLLEKVRLISQAPGERNYHVFYEILAGFPALKKQSAQDFRMTCVSGTFDRRDGVNDRDTYAELLHALDTVGFTKEEQADLFTVACGLLYISNLTFVEESEDASSLDPNNRSLMTAIDLLGVDPDALNNALTTCAIEARGETLYKNLSIDRAEKAAEALIKTTYGALFTHIVWRINSFISIRQNTSSSSQRGQTRAAATASIGVLDIFGFESFDRNSFEQLCINYCNEALQQQFNRFVFKLEQQEYQKEGIDWSFIAFPDNQDVLDLIEKRHDGILSVLDEQSRLPRCTDATFASAVYQKCSSHDRFEATKAMQAQLSFAIRHYAGLVEYDAEFFLEKNKDELPKETTELLKSSSYPFLAMLGLELTKSSAPSASTPTMTKALARSSGRQLQRASSSLLRDSVGSQFCAQLKVLRTRIESTVPHYVRCLKPNDDLIPRNFNALVIADQLRCAGVLEAIRVSRVGFPNRYKHDHFVQRYGLLERTAIAYHKIRSSSGKDLCGILVELLAPKLMGALDPETDSEQSAIERKFLGMQMGKSKVFIRRRAYETLEQLRSKKLLDSAIKIQSASRMFLKRINYEIALYAVILIQKFARQIGAHRLLCEQRIEHATALIQKALRCYMARKRLNAARGIACWCQSSFRGAIARQYCAYVFLDQKASTIQHAWRRFLSARTFRKVRSAVVSIQNRYRSRKAVRELRFLHLEARDLAAVAAERDKFKEESKRLRKELENAKSPEIPKKAPPTPGRKQELERLRSEVKNLKVELEKAHGMSSPSKSVDLHAQSLSEDLARREKELETLRQEIAVLRSRDDHSSLRSMLIDTSMRGSSASGSFHAHSSPLHRDSPARSDVSLLDDDMEDDLRSLAAPLSDTGTQQDVTGNELQHLHTAIRQRSKRHLDQVLHQTSEVCVLINQGDKYGRTAMHLASMALDLDVAEMLVTKGAVVNAQDDDGETPLHLAENAAMTEFLLSKKGRANPNIPNVDGICALHLAVQRRDVESVRALVMHNANVNNADNIRWFTPLHLLALPARNETDETPEARCQIAQLLTGVYGQNTPDTNYQDSEGNSPLHYAVQLETEDACDFVNMLLESGANPNLRNMRNQVPLHLLCHNDGLRNRKNFQEVIHALISHGADPSLQSLTGCTPLHLSLYHRDIDGAVQLVQGGAELHLVWKKPTRWPTFWEQREPAGVLALDMVENANDTRRILAAITTPHKLAPTRTCCMHCKAKLRSYSRAVHCRNCSRLTCGKCSSSCLPAEYFPKSFDVREPSWACTVCEKTLTAQKEVMSHATQPTSSYGDDDDRYHEC